MSAIGIIRISVRPMTRILSLTIEFFTNLQLIAISSNETLKEAVTEIKTIVIVILVRVVFAFVEKYGKKWYKNIKLRRRKNDD